LHQQIFSSKRLSFLLLAFCIAGGFLAVSDRSASQAQPVTPAETYVSGSITTDTTWTHANSPYYVMDDLEIEAGATLTIEPGVSVYFVGKYYIYVRPGASIIAKGTPAAHITFDKQPVAGSRNWKKIWFEPNTTSYFRYVDFAHAGSQAYDDDATLDFDGPGTHVINNCTIQYGEQQGIVASNSGLDVTIAGTLFHGNGRQAITADNGAHVVATGNTFDMANKMAILVREEPTGAPPPTVVVSNSNLLSDEGTYTIYNRIPGSACVQAQNNWWGAANGPYDASGGGDACGAGTTNSGSGSWVTNGTNYQGWLTDVAPRVGITTTPVASFTVVPAPGVAWPVGTEYTFDGSVSADVEDYTSSLDFCWDWEDDGSCDETGMTATHSYAAGGWHTARLTVTDTDGLTDTVTQDILSSWPPTATFTITQTNWSEFQFDASGSSDVETTDKALLQAYWDWEGDEVLDTGPYSVTHVLTHSYSHVGRYWPTVSVVDTDTVTGTYSLPVDVIPPAANMTISGGEGTLVSADGTITVTIEGGVIGDGVVITHTPWITVPIGYSDLPGDFTYQGFNLAAASGGSAGGPYAITVTYDLDYYGNVLGLWASESLLKLYRWTGSAWELVPFMIDSGQLIAATDSFGDFALVLESEKVYLPFALKSY
jgi:hypothetical protein